MDDGKVRGNVVAAIFFCRRKAEHMVVLVDGAAHRAQGIVAVGERIGDGELRKPARLRRLDDADVGDVVRDDGVKLQPQILRVADVVRL